MVVGTWSMKKGSVEYSGPVKLTRVGSAHYLVLWQISGGAQDVASSSSTIVAPAAGTKLAINARWPKV